MLRYAVFTYSFLFHLDLLIYYITRSSEHWENIVLMALLDWWLQKPLHNINFQWAIFHHVPSYVSFDQRSWFASCSHLRLVSLFIPLCFVSCRTSLSEAVCVWAVCVYVCVYLPSGFYQLVSNVSVVAEDPLITPLSLPFSGAIKDTSSYQEAALGDWQA